MNTKPNINPKKRPYYYPCAYLVKGSVGYYCAKANTSNDCSLDCPEYVRGEVK